MPYIFNPFTGNFDAVNLSFKTFVPTAGTNVVADNANDTVTLTSSDSALVITGTAATDTLNFTGGPAAYSFKTIVTPTGTSPVADQMGDTLQLLDSNGLEIFGSASGDSIEFANTLTIDQCLANGDTASQTMYFNSDATGIQWTVGTNLPGFIINGGDLYLKDNNNNTGFVIEAQSVLLATTRPIRFRDTALFINSSVDGQLDIAADVKCLVTAPVLQCSTNLTVGSTTTLNSLVYTWPASQSGTQFLQNNGSGTLSWVSGSVSAETLAQTLVAGNSSGGTAISMTTTDAIQFRASTQQINSSAVGQLDIDAASELELTAPIFDLDASTGMALDGANLNSNWLVNTSNEIRLRDTSTRLYSNASNQVTLEATTMTNIGVVGDIQLGDGTLRVMYPQTDAKIDLGSTSFMFNAAWFKGVVNANTAGLRTKRATTNTANPPTNAELVTAFGSAASTGSGFIGILDDNNAGTNEYIVWSDGTNYFYATGTKAV